MLTDLQYPNIGFVDFSKSDHIEELIKKYDAEEHSKKLKAKQELEKYKTSFLVMDSDVPEIYKFLTTSFTEWFYVKSEEEFEKLLQLLNIRDERYYNDKVLLRVQMQFPDFIYKTLSRENMPSNYIHNIGSLYCLEYAFNIYKNSATRFFNKVNNLKIKKAKEEE